MKKRIEDLRKLLVARALQPDFSEERENVSFVSLKRE